MATEQARLAQSRFRKKMIAIPYLIFAVILCFVFIIFPDITLVMTLFGLFFVYNVAVIFIAFLKKYNGALLYAFILTIFVAGLFGVFAYMYFTMHH